MKSMPDEGHFDNRHLSETGRWSNFAAVAVGIAGSSCPGGRLFRAFSRSDSRRRPVELALFDDFAFTQRRRFRSN
jgi:hypothetical protein